MASDSKNEQNEPSILDTIIEVNTCKNCKNYYKSLLKHLGQKQQCKNSYSEQELKKVKVKITSASNSLKREKQ